ncbi:MAG TPA: gliding motility protein GldM [Flavobacteriales bacterium]|nr:gliding motility protein GldM [Flavobacteriales bacterium]
MAGAQLPPRQKMINMMYLVLTAILALNVSKEVLDAFAIMDTELVRSGHANEQRSAVEYTVFADAAKRFPEKFKAPHERALRVKQQADSLVEHIERIKMKAVAEADGLPLTTLRGKDADGRDTLRTLLALNAKDDRETLTRMMVGSEPASPIREPGGAYDLRVRITAFRDSLKAITGSKGPELSAALDLLFDFNDRRDASGTMNNWESTNFYDVPLAAGVATLSKLQADIRSSENDLVKWLYRSVTVKEHSFSTLTTAVIPQSSLIMAGDSFRADVFLAAYDPKNRPTVTVNSGAILPIGADGKAKLRLRGDHIGEQLVQGVITFEGPDGPEKIPYSTTFQVMAPLLVASPTKMNVLYRGVENPIDLSVPGVAPDRVQATISTGRIVRKGAGWVATGMTGSYAEVNATVQLPDGGSRRIGPVRFRVKELPPPTAFVAGKSARENKVKKAELTAAPGVIAKLEDSEFNDPWQVMRFVLTVQRKGGPVIELASTSNVITSEMKTVLAALRAGDQVYFEDIKARLANGHGTPKDLAPVALKIIQ